MTIRCGLCYVTANSEQKPAWHKAALEVNRRLVVPQVEATRFQIKSTQATAWATNALVAATFFLALSSIIQAVALAVYLSGI